MAEKAGIKIKIPLWVQFVLGTLIMAGCGVLLSWYLYHNGLIASGNDVWGHLLKSDLMYQGIQEGNYYPLYTNLWYNGVQPFRYWAPIPYYIMAALEFVTAGDTMLAYFLFAGVVLFVGGMGWMLFGASLNRIPFATAFGILWFFLPENVRVFFCEGNIPRIVTAMLTPYLLYFVWRFVKREKNFSMIGIVAFMTAISLSHLMISAMTGVATFLFLLFYGIAEKKWKRSIEVLAGILLNYLLVGVWLIPALKGGLVSMNSGSAAELMASLSYSLLQSLNPVNRYTGIIDTFYYGISIVLVAVIGILFARKKEKSGYYTVLLILLLTSTAAVPLLSKLPLSQVFWMMRFATIAYGYFGLSLLEWTKARKYFSVILLLILVVDCIPSFQLQRYYTQSAQSTQDEVELAKEITSQRAALLDLSAYGSFPSYGLCTGQNAISYTYGWAWQGAATSENIVMLNTALENEKYEYLFDRCLELGNDTVMLPKVQVGKTGKSQEDVFAAAALSGYTLYEETEDMYLFHQDTPEQFGVQTTYTGLAIGSYAPQISLDFPNFVTGLEENLDDYSLEELSAYEYIYLSGFTYHSREAAEALIQAVSETGTKVIVDMNHVPVDRSNNRMHFMDVYAYEISFETFFPTLFYGNQMVNANYISRAYDSWNTVYLEGDMEVCGTGDYSGEEVAFAGTNENGNVIYLGFNLLFHAIETQDAAVFALLEDLTGCERLVLPERSLVPISISYEENKICITAGAANAAEPVNTTIAFQDNFSTGQEIEDQYHLLLVYEKETIIDLELPMWSVGSKVSAAGLFLIAGYIAMLPRINRKKK